MLQASANPQPERCVNTTFTRGPVRKLRFRVLHYIVLQVKASISYIGNTSVVDISTFTERKRRLGF